MRQVEFFFEIRQPLATITEAEAGRELRLNLISFCGDEPKLDLRRWRGDRMGRGLTIDNAGEAARIRDALDDYLKTV